MARSDSSCETSSQSDLESAPFISGEKRDYGHSIDSRNTVSNRVLLACRGPLRYVLVAVISSFMTTFLLRGYDRRVTPSAVSCDDMQYIGDSPLRDLDRSFHVQTADAFNYSTSPYLVHPTEADVDARWDALGVDSGHFLVPVTEGEKYGLDKRRHVTLPAELVGEESYTVSLDVMHHLHCLDTLRTSLWYNWEWYKVNDTHGHAKHAVELAHTNHCLDALRKRIMCLSDVTFIPSVWIDREGWILPDFGREHMCHNFDAVRDWAYENQMPVAARNYTPIPGPDAILTTLPGFYDIYPERNNKDHSAADGSKHGT